MSTIPPDAGQDQRLTADQLARLSDTEFFGVLNRSWAEEAQAAEEAGDAEELYDGHLIVGGMNRLHAGQVRTEDGLQQLQGVVRRTQDAVAEELRQVAATQAATDARVTATNTEVDRIRAFVQSYNSWLYWAVDGACVAIIIGATLLYLSWLDVDLTLGNLGTAILIDVVLIVVALAITSHIRRLDDPPAPPAQGGNGAAQPQPAPVAQQANPAAPTEQIPVVRVQQHPAPPPPPAARSQANP